MFSGHPPTHLPLTLFPFPCPFTHWFSNVELVTIHHSQSLHGIFPFHMFGHPPSSTLIEFPILASIYFAESNPVCSAFSNFFQLEIMYSSSYKKTKMLSSSPITSWQIEGGKVEAVADFIFLGSKITAVTAAMKLKDAFSLERKI